ncbi:three-Cys-motif partner protein TcmP [Methylobacterium sp. E-045]|uniref:three-Cys-motif partner protein TcmP n=1 Tax=Methylobacterium sp. E-045 TaxID=2836575 RepID=UPI00391C3FB2
MAGKFFNEREDQSAVKAVIVSKYLFAWAKIIVPWAQRNGNPVAYLDLYAGPGRYKDGSASTPLMIIEKAIADPSLRKSLLTLFNDEDPEHTDSLAKEFAKIPDIGALTYQPKITTGDVGGSIATWLQTARMVPTFSFIDPFGYIGLSLGLIKGAIKDWGCDCVFFFNYNRINAGISNEAVDKHMTALFGEVRTSLLRDQLAGLTPVQREALILENIAGAIKGLGGKFVLPFRFRNASGTRSTHYLIFVSKHERGYEVMKEIMAKESSTNDQGVPSLEYSPADARTPLLFSLQRSLDGLAAELLHKYQGQTIRMEDVYRRHHVDTRFIKKNYKDALLSLETENKITAKPAKRRPGTFGDDVTASFPGL